MKSRTVPKVLHAFSGRTLLGHVLAATEPLAAAHTMVVVGHGREQVVEHLTAIAPGSVPVVQDVQHGTGHATRLALDAVPAPDGGMVVVVPGDTPLLTGAVLAQLVAEHRAAGAAATLLTSVVGDPAGYGRVIRAADGAVVRVVEHKDAAPEELTIAEVATSVYAFDAALLRDALGKLSTDNAQGEEYLTDVIGILAAAGHPVAAVVAPEETTAGVNDRVQLAAAHRVYNTRLLEQHMRNGVTIVDPLTTWVEAAVTIEPDAVILPSTELCGDTHIESEAVVGPQASLTSTRVGAGARVDRCVAKEASTGPGVTVGPFAYLRSSTVLAENVHIGTFVELKQADVGKGTKIPHLTYVGDASIGEHSNIGAATVFVNYDGVAKHRTDIGDHVRIGSDTMLVAPVEVGDGAYTAAGSVITEDVPPGAMGVARARQRNVAGWVVRKRAGTAAAEAATRALESKKDEG
jgi:bifunctional UDP-N-acetylglucosamine pyrophosphorylase / glucosamine-1-phosphate N-acetyltransferase